VPGVLHETMKTRSCMHVRKRNHKWVKLKSY